MTNSIRAVAAVAWISGAKYAPAVRAPTIASSLVAGRRASGQTRPPAQSRRGASGPARGIRKVIASGCCATSPARRIRPTPGSSPPVCDAGGVCFQFRSTESRKRARRILPTPAATSGRRGRIPCREIAPPPCAILPAVRAPSAHAASAMLILRTKAVAGSGNRRPCS